MIDVGANVGSISIPWLKDKDSVVYAFEPDPRVFSKLKNNVGSNERYHCINKAVSTQDGSSIFYLSVDPATSSLLPYTEQGLRKWVCPKGKKLAVESTVSVETIRLDTFLSRSGIEEVDLLKVDAQGHDLEVIRSAGGKISQIRSVILEVQITPDFELYRNSSKMGDVLSYMAQNGFELIKEENNTEGQEVNCYFRRA